MKPLRSVKSQLVLAILALGMVLASCVEREGGDPPPVRVDNRDNGVAMPPTELAVATSEKPPFDFYLLALTVHAAFCADGHANKAECQVPAKRPLVIHGLWPERLEPRTYPRDCSAPRLQLDPQFVRELEDWMPGVRSGLHVHEWREHGSCSGLEDFVYFTHTLVLAIDMDAALSAKLTTLSGRETSAAELRAAADAFRPGLGKTFTLHCRNIRDAPAEFRNRPFLIEVRQCIDKDGQIGDPATLLDCARFNRRDQGCGATFRIAGTRQ